MDNKGVHNNAFIDDISIVSVIFGKRCTYVGENAFKNCILLNEINEDNIIEDIGSNAFSRTNLISAKFNNLINLHSGAFRECNKLNYISIPKCKCIQTEAFKECVELTSINIPDCSIIEEYAFENCSKLNNINFNTIVEIKNGAFMGCKSLDTINLDACKKIGSKAFRGCESITQLTLSVCEEIEESAFIDCSIAEVYVNTTQNIFCKLKNKNVFCKCDNYDSSKCSIDTIFYIKADDFYLYQEDPIWKHYINNIIIIPDDNQIVYKTNNNQEIDISSYNDSENPIISNTYTEYGYGLINFEKKIEYLNQNIFKNSASLTYVKLPKECIRIEDSAFENCKNLNNILLSNVENIGAYAFKNCESFTSFNVPNSIKELGEGAFIGCKRLEKFQGKGVIYDGKAVISNGTLICVLSNKDIYSNTEGRIHNLSKINDISRLGESCFYGCENMIRVDIPSNVESIGKNAFEGCVSLYEVHLNNSNPPSLDTNVFKDVREDLKIFVPEEGLQEYYNSWSNDINIFPKPNDSNIIYYGEISNGITDSEQEYIEKDCQNGQYYKISNVNNVVLTKYFTEQSSITKVILSDAINEIEQYAFKNCKKLEYIYLPDSISNIGNECFSGCESLTRIHIPINWDKKTITVNPPITPKVYAGGDDIINLNPIPTINKTLFGHDIFYGCSKLKEFGTYYKDHVSSDNRCYIDDNTLMFFAQGDMSDEEKSYKIPNNITSINRSAFRGSQITNITLNESTKIIGDYAFEGCSQLKSIYDWDNVETISSCAFMNCSSLGEISLPSHLISINQNAFESCGEMYTNTDISNSVVSIGSGAFKDCTNFKYVNALGEDEALNLGNITHINTSMFYNCESLTKININDNIITIDADAFTNCLNLTSVLISNTSSLKNINKNAFKGCEKLTELHLPSNLTHIGTSAFENCISYKGDDNGLIIPNTLNTMGISCFKNSGVEKVTISSNLTEIPDSTFEDCTNLLEVLILGLKSNIETIGINAFKNCQSLNRISENLTIGNTYGSLRLPISVKTIKDSAFENCIRISNIYFPEELSRIGDKSFSKQSWTYIYIPENLKTPPTIKSDQILFLANPFGDNFYIYIPNKIFGTYESDLSWKKYKDNMKYYTPDDSGFPVVPPVDPPIIDPDLPIIDPNLPDMDI